MNIILKFVLLMMLVGLPVMAKNKPKTPAQEQSVSQPASPMDRPSDGDLFSDPNSPSGENNPSAPANPDQSARPPESDLFRPDSQAPVLSRSAGPEDPLKIGGVFYLRMLGGARQGQDIGDFRFSTPMLVDTYLDARPNDRVHAEFIGRIMYDPTGNSSQNSMSGTTLNSTSNTSNEPKFILNQLWVRFDIARAIFVTAGIQKIKWGTTHFWNPTDFLQPVYNPLEPFDFRTGVSMLKFHLPWEKYGWNFYAIALLEKPKPLTNLLTSSQNSSASWPTFTFGDFGAAARAEVVFNMIEVGADVVARKGQRPKYGFDISAGLDSLLHIPIDIYAEAAIRHGSDTGRWRPAPADQQIFSSVEVGEQHNPNEITPQVSCGLNWSALYNDQDQIVIGAEYFYNSLGYNDIKLYPWLIVNGAFQPFYVGQHYAALYVSLPSPGSWDNTTFTLSSIGNLTDKSFVIRLDYSVVILTYLKLEAYIAGYLGQPGGEFRFRLNTNELHDKMSTIPLYNLTTPIVDVGLSFRLDI
jgi:hypothetical protein